MAVKHHCFVSYHDANSTAVKAFIDDFKDVFTAKTVGVTDADDFINSNESDYIMRCIREKYLTTTTVTKERALYETRTGPYRDLNDHDLVEALTFRTEELISREHQVWHSTQREGHSSTKS